MSYTIADWETSTRQSYGRKANPFDKENYVVAYGVKHKGKDTEKYYMQPLPSDWLDNTKILVAHNAKFDLTWVWRNPEVVSFLKRGGKIWCTQYAEYILTGQQAQWNSLNQCAEKYGGTLKNDEIKTLWEEGVDTIDIPKDMLLDYLDDDLNNTEIVYLAQVKKARELGMLNTLLSHMEGLLALTEMEYNGLYIDQELGEKQRKSLELRLEEVIDKLSNFIPNDLPPEVEWNWGSKDHLSALFFGGNIKYKRLVEKKDDDGNTLYTKKEEHWYLLNGEPIDPKTIKDTSSLDRYKGGAKAGKLKTKKIKVDDLSKPKTRIEEFYHKVQGATYAKPEWETKKAGVYKTDADILTILSLEEDLEAAKLMLEWRKIDKDLGTYYKRYDPCKKTDVGMLTLIQQDGKIHHGLNNVGTVTGRLSSSSPNCFSDDTEVLTDSGFKLFKNLDVDKDKVAQWEDGEINYTSSYQTVVKAVEEDLVRFKTKSIDLLMTKDHRFLSTNRSGNKLLVESAENLLGKCNQIWDRKLIRAGEKVGGVTLNTDELKHLEQAVCLQAEGYLASKTTIHIEVTSNRKKEQLSRLFDSHTDTLGGGYKVILPYDHPCTKYLRLIPKSKYSVFNEQEILKLSKESMLKFLDFIHLWDGDYTRKSAYGQVVERKEAVDLVQVVACQVGISTSRYEKQTSGGNSFYVVNFHPESNRFASRTTTELEKYRGNVYCVSVPSGYIIVRRGNSPIVIGNCQNISRGDKSEVKSLFTSRFDDGYMVESDFSQLEVVVQGLLSGDTNLINDINSGIDFHVKRLSVKLQEAYDDVFNKAKVEEDPVYVKLRQDSKEFSFQRAYGAGVAAIVESTGMHPDEVKSFISAEEEMYPSVVEFNKKMGDVINESRVVTKNKVEVDGQMCNVGVGWFGTITGKRYVFREQPTPPFMRKPKKWDKSFVPKLMSFSPTQIKNYAVQGLAGEIVIMCLGYLFRKFLETDNFGGKALLTNTVHDCVWVDAHKDVVEEVANLVEKTLSSAKELFEERYKVECPVKFRAETEVGRNMLSMGGLHKFKI